MRWTSAAAPALLLMATAFTCQGPHLLARAAGAQHALAAAADDDTSRQVWARRWLVSTRLEPRAIDSFAQLTAEQRQVLRRLQQQSQWTFTVTALGGRLLLAVPPTHPVGPLELLLSEDLKCLVAFNPSRKQSYRLRRHQLPDALDGGGASRREDFELQLEPLPPGSLAVDEARGLRTRGLRAVVGLRYFPEADRPLGWQLKLTLQQLFPDSPRPFFDVYQQPLQHVALPLLQNRRGVQVLESLALASGSPLAWSLEVVNEGRTGGAPPVFRIQVADRGHVRIPWSMLAEQRSGYQAARGLPRLLVAGRQLVEPGELQGLRGEQGKSGTLEVANRSSTSALIYADGVLLGWVNAGRRVAFRGLPAGYYRLYAVSPTGVRYWGPFDRYVPGPLTLR